MAFVTAAPFRHASWSPQAKATAPLARPTIARVTMSGYSPVVDEFFAKDVTRQYIAKACPSGVPPLQCIEGTTADEPYALRTLKRQSQLRYRQLPVSVRVHNIISHGARPSRGEPRMQPLYRIKRAAEDMMCRSVENIYSSAVNGGGVFTTACTDGQAKYEAYLNQVRCKSTAFRVKQYSPAAREGAKFAARKMAIARNHICVYEDGLYAKYPRMAGSMRPAFGYYQPFVTSPGGGRSSLARLADPTISISLNSIGTIGKAAARSMNWAVLAPASCLVRLSESRMSEQCVETALCRICGSVYVAIDRRWRRLRIAAGFHVEIAFLQGMYRPNWSRGSNELHQILRDLLPSRPVFDEGRTLADAVYEYKVMNLGTVGRRVEAVVLIRMTMATTGVQQTRSCANVISDISAHSGDVFTRRRSEQSPLRFKNNVGFYLITHHYECVGPSCGNTINVRSWLLATTTGIGLPTRTSTCSHCGARGHMGATCCEAPGIFRVQINWRRSHIQGLRSREAQAAVDTALGFRPTKMARVDGAVSIGDAVAFRGIAYDSVAGVIDDIAQSPDDDDNRVDELEQILSAPIEAVLPADSVVEAFYDLVGYIEDA
eukprot:IDg8654t1